MDGVSAEPNRARRAAAETFLRTLLTFGDEDNITEKRFAISWREALAGFGDVTINGWYDPPPHGIAVLTGLGRVAFTSLRPPENWPSNELIDWREGTLYVYCSPVNVIDKIPGDFSVTLYFGHDLNVREHFRKSIRATHEVLAIALEETSSRRLFRKSCEVFSGYGLSNRVATYASTGEANIGHTLPRVTPLDLTTRELRPSQRELIRNSRYFINEESDWDLTAHEQFTIEPQLVNQHDRTVPPVSLHYVVLPATRAVLAEPDDILGRFDLIDRT